MSDQLPEPYQGKPLTTAETRVDQVQLTRTPPQPVATRAHQPTHPPAANEESGLVLVDHDRVQVRTQEADQDDRAQVEG